MRKVSKCTVHSETDASLASSWKCRHWATGLGGRQAARSRPSDRRRMVCGGGGLRLKFPPPSLEIMNSRHTCSTLHPSTYKIIFRICCFVPLAFYSHYTTMSSYYWENLSQISWNFALITCTSDWFNIYLLCGWPFHLNSMFWLSSITKLLWSDWHTSCLVHECKITLVYLLVNNVVTVTHRSSGCLLALSGAVASAGRSWRHWTGAGPLRRHRRHADNTHRQTSNI